MSKVSMGIEKTGNPTVDEANRQLSSQAVVMVSHVGLDQFHEDVYLSVPEDKVKQIARTQGLDKDVARAEIKRILCDHMLDEIEKKAGMGDTDTIMKTYTEEKGAIISAWKPNSNPFSPSLTNLGKELDTTLARLNKKDNLLTQVDEASAAVKKVENKGRMDELPQQQKQIAHVKGAADIIRNTPVAERHAITAASLQEKHPQQVGSDLKHDAKKVKQVCEQLLKTDRHVTLKAHEASKTVFTTMKEKAASMYDRFRNTSSKESSANENKAQTAEPPTYKK
jgi:hypothetical protein